MSFRRLGSLLAAYFLALAVTASILRGHVALGEPSHATTVRSTWKDGVRVARQVFEGDPGPLVEAGAADEKIVGEGPIAMGKTFFPFGLVAGRDGVKATLDGKTVYATVDDLLSAQAYDHATSFMDASFGIGTHRAAVLHILASQLGVDARDLEARGSFRRVRFERTRGDVTPDNVTTARAREGIRAAARQLAGLVDGNGRFRYLFDATTDKTLAGYNWPRHSGATYFLAQAAAMLDDGEVRFACLRAASQLREAMKACGENKCIASDGEDADVGSSALALVAFAEIARTGADGWYAVPAAELAAFLRAQQRPDGELMHYFDRNAQKPIDIQVMYYTGEAALGLSRAHRVTKDPRDLEAAKRALGHLSGAGWTFFGSRYYYGEEHWTCQAAEDLWDRAPNDEALGFCLRWHEFQRRIQHQHGDSPYDAEGAFGVGPITSPRVTPASSRGEAGVAALDVLLREKKKGHPIHEDDIPLLDAQLRRSVSFVLRHQMVPGNVTWQPHLFPRPDEVRGAFPGSPVDWQLRIDYVQHAGSLLIRWVETLERDRAR